MLRNIPSATLRQLVSLSKRKEALMAQIQEIDRQMSRLESKLDVPSKSVGRPAHVTVSRTGRKPARRQRTK